MPRKKVDKSGIDSTISDAERFPLFESLILAAEPDNDGKTESVRLDGVAIRQYAESTIAKKETGISDRTLYLFGKAESGEEMTGAEFDELERGMREQGLDDRAIQQQRDIYNSQRLRRRNTEAIMNAGGGALRAPDGSLQIVHPSTMNPGQYQVSRFGKSGITGDSQFGSIEDAVRFAHGTGHTELASGKAANDALIQAIEAESSRGAQQTEPRAVSHPDPAIDGKNVLTKTQDGRVIEAMASHEKPPRGIQRFERPGGEQSQAAQKQPWQMTRAEYYLQENGPIVAAIQDAMRDGRRIELRTQYRITPLRSLDHVRLTSRGEVQIREGKGWVTLFDSQIDNLARQAGMELPPYLDRTFHINYVEEALREGKPVTREVLADYPSLQNQAEDEDELRGQNEERLKADTLSGHFSDLFTQGRSFSSITEARKVASDFLGKEIKPGTIEAKEADEAIELGVVLAARKIVVENHGNPQATYAALVDLYNRQPNLNVRTSTSVANQAYSTPVPIAYVASRLAGIDENTTVDEPTAGNGALLIAAEPENVHANELDPKRAQALRDQGFSVTTSDATAWTPKGKFDVVIANPPFGVVKNDLGASIGYTLLPNFRTTEIDQAIAFKALEAMKNDGRAVLILGGLNKLEKTRQARSDGYNVAAKRRFYYYLYQNYNVVDHFTVAGELYEKQGSGWPVDVIVIDGRGKSSRALPAVDVPRLYESFDGLKDVLDQAPARAVRVGVSAQPGSVSDTGRSGAETRSSEFPDTAGRPDRGYGERVGEPERSGDVHSGEPRPSRPTAAEQTRAPGTGNEQSGTARAPQRAEGVSDAGRGGEIRQPGGAEAGEGNQLIIAQAEKNVDTHCLDTQTEILTPQGFKSYRDDFTEVAAFELRTGAITWRPVTGRVLRPLSGDEYMIGIEGPSLDVRVTNHHRMVYHTRRRQEWAILEAHEMAALGGGYSIPIAGLQDPEYKLSLSDSEIRIIGWYLTDGSISQKSHQLMIWQSEHQPYHDHIKNSLEGCGLKYTIQRYDHPTQHKQTSARLCYLVSKGRGDVRGWGYLAEYLDKNFSPLLDNLSRDQLAVLLETLHYGDGTKFENQPWTRHSYHIATGNKTFAERLQSLCVRRGFKCNLAERDYNQNPLFFLHIKDQHKRYVGGRNAIDRPTFQPVPHDAAELVWCVENSIGTLVIRRNGKVAIVGNCQMLGRVHRTGQVAPPRYTQLAADIPAEKRPAAVLAKKMASLNANTTAARGSAVTAKDVVDFLNEFGDKVAANLMREDQNLWLQLGQPAYEDEEAGGVKQDAMRRITGRIPILPIEQQEAVYKRLEDEYRDYIAFLEATGASTLEAKTLDLQAETRSTDPLTTPKGGDSPFTRASAIEKARVRRLGKPMTSEQVAEMVRKSLGEQSGDLDKLQAVGDERAKELMEQMTGEHAKFAEQRMEGFQLEIDGLREKVDKTEDSQEKTKLQRKLDAAELRLETARADTQKALLTWRALVQTLHPGSQVQLNTEEGSFYGVAVSLECKGEQKNPVALSGWRVNVAVADGARSIQFPLSQVMTEATQESHGGPIIASYADSMPIYNAETGTFDRVPIAEAFDKGQSESMETRNIVTGNILAGFEAVKGKGQIVNYTDKDGNVRQGILMPRNWDREKELKQRDIVFKTADQALEFLSANGRLKTRDGDLVLMSNAKGDLMLAANKAKSSGGKYYLNKKIIDAVGKDFVSGGGMMRAPVSKDQARKVIDLLASGEAMGQPTLFLADNMPDKAREIVERSKGEGSAVEAGAPASIGERLKIDGISLEARKHAEDLVSYWTDFANDRTDFQTLAENSRVEYVRDPQNARAGIIYMNSHARRFYELILSEENEKDVSFEVLATPGHNLVEHQKLLDKYMVTYTANPDAVRAMNAIKEAISLAQTDGVDGVVFFDVHLPGEYWEQASAHEGFHVWQYGAPELSDGWVERQPGYDQIRAELLARNYEDDPAAIAREWAAYAVTDDLERFGFTRDEGARFLHAYFSEIINQGGIEVIDRVGNVSPRAQSIIETKRWRHARNQSQSQQQARTEAGGPGASPGPETSEITTGRGPAGDRISLQGRSGNGRERGGRAPDGAEVGRDQLAGSTEALKPVRYYEAQGFTPINPASGLHLDSRLAEQGFSNENTIQRRGATTEALMTALQTIANIEAPDPSGRRSLKELSATVGRIALAAIADAGGAELVQDKEEGAALGKIAGIMASDHQGRLLSLQERIDDAVKIARATIGEIESRMLAQSVMVNAAEMAQPRQPSTPSHEIGW